MSKTYDELKRAEQARRMESYGACVSAGIRIKGKISGSGDLVVDGNVEGSIHLEGGMLTVGAKGTVIGDIVAREVIICGSVKGNLRVRDRFEIKIDGSVVGDVVTARSLIENGAYFKGSIEIGEQSVGTGLAHSTAATAAAANSPRNL